MESFKKLDAGGIKWNTDYCCDMGKEHVLRMTFSFPALFLNACSCPNIGDSFLYVPGMSSVIKTAFSGVIVNVRTLLSSAHWVDSCIASDIMTMSVRSPFSFSPLKRKFLWPYRCINSRNLVPLSGYKFSL